MTCLSQWQAQASKASANRGALQCLCNQRQAQASPSGSTRDLRAAACGRPSCDASWPSGTCSNPDIMLACPAAQGPFLSEPIRCHVLPPHDTPILLGCAFSPLPVVPLTEHPLACPTSTEGPCRWHAGHNHTQIAEAAHPPSLCPQLQIAAPCLAANRAQEEGHAMPCPAHHPDWPCIKIEPNTTTSAHQGSCHSPSPAPDSHVMLQCTI